MLRYFMALVLWLGAAGHLDAQTVGPTPASARALQRVTTGTGTELQLSAQRTWSAETRRGAAIGGIIGTAAAIVVWIVDDASVGTGLAIAAGGAAVGALIGWVIGSH